MDQYQYVCVSFVMILSACGNQYGTRPLRGNWITVVSGDRISKIAQKYSVPQQDIIEINGLRDPSRILVGQQLFIPIFARDLSHRGNHLAGAITSSDQTDRESSSKQWPGFKSLHGASVTLMRQVRWPLSLSLKAGVGLSSGFGVRKGKLHKGIDIRAPLGTPVYAALGGEVIRSENSSGGYGWVIYLRHTDGVETRYAHHKKNIVRVGQVVQAGSMIALVGNSGRSTGPHLHFEIRIQGKAVDPLIFLPAVSSTLSRDVPLYRLGLKSLLSRHVGEGVHSSPVHLFSYKENDR